jgi:hypothetical protein
LSANHDGYEQAMQDIFSILDAHRALGGKTRQNEDSLEAIRIALESLRASNLRCAKEAKEKVPGARGAS